MKQRIEHIRASLPAEADGILLCSPVNIRYLTGVNLTDGYLLITRQKALLFADSRYEEAAQKHKAEGVDVLLLKGIDVITTALADVQCLCFEDQYVTCFDYKNYKKSWPDIRFIGCGSIVSELREIKNEDEIQCIEKAQRIAEKAFDHILGFLSPERTEAEVALELEYVMRKQGADGIAFDTIAVSGAASSLPHGEPTRQKLFPGFLTMDFGAVVNGYCSDMTRTVVIGKADADMKMLYQTVLDAQQAALSMIAPDVRCAAVDQAAREHIDAVYPGAFGHGLGHGVGLDIHEAPNLSPKSSKILRPGQVVTVEPGIYLPGKYGVRIEDMVVITEQGCINLTKAPKNLIEC
ncbi:MAG: aminopeptidase P family protein [Clostridiales bacterium]|nr:aminopeptidase P family protein [Clostridiales bacterium]